MVQILYFWIINNSEWFKKYKSALSYLGLSSGPPTVFAMQLRHLNFYLLLKLSLSIRPTDPSKMPKLRQMWWILKLSNFSPYNKWKFEQGQWYLILCFATHRNKHRMHNYTGIFVRTNIIVTHAEHCNIQGMRWQNIWK